MKTSLPAPNPNLNLNPPPNPHSPDDPFQTLITTVAHFYRIPPALACGPDRHRKAAWPRQVAMTLCCEFFPHLPLTAISQLFHRTHSTVSHARRCVLSAQKNARTRADLARLRHLLHLKLSADPPQ